VAAPPLPFVSDVVATLRAHPELAPRLTCADFRDLPLDGPFDYLVVIQVFPHGLEADASSVLRAGRGRAETRRLSLRASQRADDRDLLRAHGGRAKRVRG
jgi:hypothetical protein